VELIIIIEHPFSSTGLIEPDAIWQLVGVDMRRDIL
jgi:hypothetical protein